VLLGAGLTKEMDVSPAFSFMEHFEWKYEYSIFTN